MVKQRVTPSAYTRTRNRVRDRLRNERTANEEFRRGEAARILSRVNLTPEEQRKKNLGDALLFNTALLAHKVLGSFGVDVPIKVGKIADDSPYPLPVQAWTDFHSLNIMVRVGAIDVLDLDSVVEFVSMVKGVVYHEGGHILFTKPYSHMVGELKQPEHLQRFANTRATVGDQMLHRAWNILEDQRQETGMVHESPALKSYFSTVVLSVVIDPDQLARSYPYITQRAYLDPGIQTMIRDAALASDKAELVAPTDDVAYRYCVAETPVEQVFAVCDFAELLQQWEPLSPTSETQHVHSAWHTPKNTIPANVPTPPMPVGNQQEQSNESNQGNQDKQDNKDNQGTGSEPQEESSNNEQGDISQSVAEPKPNASDSAGQHPQPGNDAGSDNSDVRGTISKEVERLRNDMRQEARNFIANVHKDVSGDLPRDTNSRVMDTEDVSKSNQICGEIISALEHLIDQTSPSWRFRQEHGVIDATSYIMRDPGDTDYWSGMDGEGGQGYDLAVSVLLDTSYSMYADEKALSISALGIRKACDALEIPCTITTWNTEYRMLYSADDETTPLTVTATGGTQPVPMLDQIDSHRYDKTKHLVIILTDGEWETDTKLTTWSSPGRFFLLVGLRLHDDSILTSKRPDAAVIIHNVKQLPREFGKAIAGYLA